MSELKCNCKGVVVIMRVKSRCYYVRCLKCGKEGDQRTSPRLAVAMWKEHFADMDGLELDSDGLQNLDNAVKARNALTRQ